MFVYVLAIFAILLMVFMFGRKFPDRKKSEEIARDGMRDHVASWCQGTGWICVQVIQDSPYGPFGSPIREIVLERDLKRIVFCYSRNDIVVGTYVQLSKRTGALDSGCRRGIEDECMTAKPFGA
jgi:hypothetical protein